MKKIIVTGLLGLIFGFAWMGTFRALDQAEAEPVDSLGTSDGAITRIPQFVSSSTLNALVTRIPNSDLWMGNATITVARLCLTGDTCRTTWPAGGGSSAVYLSTTTPWTNGNLAYVTGLGTVGSVATGTLTESVTGLELNATRALVGGSAILALTSNYVIPLNASTTEWSTAYASTTNLTPTYIRGLFSNTTTGLTYTGATGVTALTAGYNIPLTASTTEWAQAYATSTLLTPTYIRNLFSNTATGLTYTAGTGALSLTANYIIPLTASTTEWANFYATPSTRITAGSGLSWSGNTLNNTGASKWTLLAGGVQTATSTDFAQSAYFIASSTTGTSTFAGRVGIASSSPVSALGVTGTTTTTALNISGLVPTSGLFLDANRNATATALSASLITSLQDETGSGVAVFGTSPAITTSITTPSTSFTAWAGATTLLTIGGTGASASLFAPSTLDTTSFTTGAIRTSGGISAVKALNIGTTGTFGTGVVTSLVTGTSTASGVLSLKSTSGVGTSDRISMLVGNNGATEAIRISSNGNVSIGTTTSTSSELTVVAGPSANLLTLIGSAGTTFLNMLATGVTTLLGEWDFGGATSLEIPNGSSPTVNTLGEIALDTSGDQLLVAESGATERVVQIEDVKIWGRTIASSSLAFVNAGLMPLTTQLDGYTITRIQCHVYGGTSKVIAVEDASGNSSEDITCATTNTTDDGSITNATYTASELSLIDFGATTGAVDYVSISVFGNWTRE